MNKRILFTANLESFFTKFLIPQLEYFKKNGYDVHIAAKSENKDIPFCDKKYDVSFARGFNIFQNIKSYFQLKRVLKDNHYDIISCHTPFGGAITRLAAKKCRKKGTKVVYMAHGFHFYEGQSKLKNLVYYFAEKYLAKYCDELITINLYDYKIAKNRFKTNVSYVEGVGIDPKKMNVRLTNQEKEKLKKNLGLKETDFVMIYPGEIYPLKRQDWLIETLRDTLKLNSDFHLLLPGKDSLNGKCQKLANDYNIEKQIHFLGFRTDIPELLNITDLVLSTSTREGLPVIIMEAIYYGLPVVCTDCRGNKDLIDNGKNGYVVGVNDRKEFVEKVLKIYNLSLKEREKIRKIDKEKINKYLLSNVLNKTVEIYKR